MIFLFFQLFINVVFGFNLTKIDYTTSIYRNGRIYVYEPNDIELKWSGLTIYDLKDGPISDIKPQLANFTNSNPIYTPQFLQLPQGLPNGRSYQTWMIGGINKEKLKDNSLSETNWSCEIRNGSELKFHNDFIPMPPFKNFPKSGFSQTVVNGNNGPELYIIGGLVYSKELDKELITNYFYKYEFNTGNWIDLNNIAKAILQPRAFHKIIQVDSSLLLFGGIQNNENMNGNFEHTVVLNDDSDLGNITTISKFDLRSQEWSTVTTKLNKDPSIYKSGQDPGSVYDLYNGKIISYISLYNYVKNAYEPQIGILNYNTWEWEWHDVKTEAGIDNSLSLSYYQTLIINSQLILIHGVSNQSQVKKLYVINLGTFTFQGSININGGYKELEVSGLPGWVVAISVIGSIILTILIAKTWFYLRYKKGVKVDKNNNSEQEMQEVWASAAHENIRLTTRAALFINCNMENSRSLSNLTLIDGSILGYECFLYGIELEDLHAVKSKTYTINAPFNKNN